MERREHLDHIYELLSELVDRLGGRRTLGEGREEARGGDPDPQRTRMIEDETARNRARFEQSF